MHNRRVRSWSGRGALVVLATLALSPAGAQGYPPFELDVYQPAGLPTLGSGRADGPLDLTRYAPVPSEANRVTVIFDPKQWKMTDTGSEFVPDPAGVPMELDTDDDNVFHFSRIFIPPYVTLKLTGPLLNMAPVYFLVTGGVTIAADGILDLSGEDGALANTPRRIAVPGPGGWPGAAPATVWSACPGFGPGKGYWTGEGSTKWPTSTLNAFLIPLLGGSGGACSPDSSLIMSNGGGAGGGAILLASEKGVTVNGKIWALGGKGLQSQEYSCGIGGGIRILSPIVNVTGKISTANRSYYESDGCEHARGGIRIETYSYQSGDDELYGRSDLVSVVTLHPSVAVLPDYPDGGLPRLYIESIGGVLVPDRPAVFPHPDVLLGLGNVDEDGNVEVVVRGVGIPAETSALLYIYNETTGMSVTDPFLLDVWAGVTGGVTAAIDVPIQYGYSYLLASASWGQ